MASVVKAESLQPLGYEQIVAPAVATGLTVPEGAKYALIQVLNFDLRFRDDGTDPTATVGMVLQAGDNMFYKGHLQSLQIIEAASGAEVNVLYYS